MTDDSKQIWWAAYKPPAHSVPSTPGFIWRGHFDPDLTLPGLNAEFHDLMLEVRTRIIIDDQARERSTWLFGSTEVDAAWDEHEIAAHLRDHVLADWLRPNPVADDKAILDRMARLFSAPEWPGASGLEDLAELVARTGRVIEDDPDVEWGQH